MADFGNTDFQIITPLNYGCYDLLLVFRGVLLQNNRLLVGYHFCDTFCYAIFLGFKSFLCAIVEKCGDGYFPSGAKENLNIHVLNPSVCLLL